MSNWENFGYAGIIWGLGLCAITVPLLGVTQLIFRNRLRAYWLLVCATVTIYTSGLLSFTLTPLNYAQGLVCSKHPLRLVPFHSFIGMVQDNAGSNLVELLTSWSFLQIFFNLLLFVPLGLLARAVFKRNLIVSTAVAFAVSLFIELSQLTALWGIFPCAYRIFDVDDLMVNTLGGCVGAAIAHLWVSLRSREEKPLPWGKNSLWEKTSAEPRGTQR